MKLSNSPLADLANLILPPACLVCGNKLDEQKQVLCENCEARLIMLGSNVCTVCGGEMGDDGCDICREEKFAFDKARSVFKFSGPVKDLIHILKYDGYVSPAGYFALPLAELIESDPTMQDADYICAVPLHKVRKRERGYNQSELVAIGVSALTGLPCESPVERKVYTNSQTLLSKAHRVKNLFQAFVVKDASLVEGKHIIIVDDVFTTGSTLNEMAKTLRSAGAKKITAITAARA